MSQLHQMQFTYAPIEDRILFRMNTKARQEFRFWMTRRYVQVLWNTILQILKKKVSPPAAEMLDDKPLSEPMKEAKMQVDHKAAVENSDFKTQYEESTYLPLGEAPTLLFSVGVKPGPNNNALLVLSPEKGQGIELALNDQIVHSLCKLLSETSQKAKWELNLDFAQASKLMPEQGLN
ncbi:hypothetical protein N8813_01310 [bacterium]|nr:hypothetical protein [bacterium]MDC0258825.1 hypothetical protein [Verrucomicrobiales bacterium]